MIAVLFYSYLKKIRGLKAAKKLSVNHWFTISKYLDLYVILANVTGSFCWILNWIFEHFILLLSSFSHSLSFKWYSKLIFGFKYFNLKFILYICKHKAHCYSYEFKILSLVIHMFCLLSTQTPPTPYFYFIK